MRRPSTSDLDADLVMLGGLSVALARARALPLAAVLHEPNSGRTWEPFASAFKRLLAFSEVVGQPQFLPPRGGRHLLTRPGAEFSVITPHPARPPRLSFLRVCARPETT